jgi:hypothetical protein
LSSKGVNDRTTMVMENEIIFMKRNLIQQAQNECITLKINVESFSNKFENLVNMGLPSIRDKMTSYSHMKNEEKTCSLPRKKMISFKIWSIL